MVVVVSVEYYSVFRPTGTEEQGRCEGGNV